MRDQVDTHNNYFVTMVAEQASRAVVVPQVIEISNRGAFVQEIFSRLLTERIVFITGPIEDIMSSVVVAQLLFLEAENPKKEIAMYINSPGGLVTSGLAIYDTMQYIRPAVQTLCVGQAASAASLLLCAGAKGQRYSLPNSRILVHQPSASYHGQATDIARHAQEIVKLKRRLNEIYAKHTGQMLEAVEKALDRDTYMTPEEAKTFGILDEVYSRRPTVDIQEREVRLRS